MYIFWWALSAAFAFFGVYWTVRGPGNFLGMLVWSAIFIYVGYRSWKKYQEYQEDRAMMHEDFEAKTAEAKNKTDEK